LACRSVMIIVHFTACFGDHAGTELGARPRNRPDTGVRRFFNRQSRKPVTDKFVPEPLVA
jgi:hypothetical protein